LLKLRQHSVNCRKTHLNVLKCYKKSKDHKKLKLKTCLFIKNSDQTIKEKNNNTSIKNFIAKQNILLLSNKKKRNSEKKTFFLCVEVKQELG